MNRRMSAPRFGHPTAPSQLLTGRRLHILSLCGPVSTLFAAARPHSAETVHMCIDINTMGRCVRLVGTMTSAVRAYL